MEKWEYKSTKLETRGMMGGILELDEFNSKLNMLGSQGWELVSCMTTSRGNGYTREAIAVFKRQVK